MFPALLLTPLKKSKINFVLCHIGSASVCAMCVPTNFNLLQNFSNLPAKSPTEEKKHRRQYEAMIAEAKKKGENKKEKKNTHSIVFKISKHLPFLYNVYCFS